MIQADCQTDKMGRFQEELEKKLKLPVVVARSGKVYVLDALGRDVRVFTTDADLTADDFRNQGRVKKPRNRYFPYIQLFMRYPEVSVPTAEKALKKLTAKVTDLRGVHITVDTGPCAEDWEKLRQVAFVLLSGLAKSKILASMTIDGVFSRPRRSQMDWLSGKRIVTRYVFGSSLGHADEIEAETAKTFEAISGYGLRMPVLFYWSGQNKTAVAELLKKALRLNKLAGVSILPQYLSPRFDCGTMLSGRDFKTFSEVLGFLHADRLLCEYLDDTSSDIEERLADSPLSHCSLGVITEAAKVLPFRRFPFAASTAVLNNLFKARMYDRCKRCSWRRICGGVDCSPSAFRQQHKIVADAWCANRKIFMQRIVLECLAIREQLNQFKDRLLKDAS